MKFSIVVPVYNVEKYINKALDSILNQTYNNFEVIIVNDGSTDNSQKIIDKYTKLDKRFKSYKKVTGGLSSTRNFGIKYTTGDYLLFIDSDDYIEKDYLEQANKVIKKNKVDILKTNMVIVNEEYKIVRKEKLLNKTGYVNFNDLTKLEFLDTACGYIYNLDFYKKNKFTFAEGLYHEDFGLILEIIIKSKNIYYLDYYSYYYLIRENSIMTAKDKIKKRAYDVIKHYNKLKNIIYSADITRKEKDAYMYYIENTAISKIYNFKNNKDEYNKYKKELKKCGIYKFTCNSNYKYIIKKILLKLSIKMYLKYVLKMHKRELI